jgi:hypothetical protein
MYLIFCILNYVIQASTVILIPKDHQLYNFNFDSFNAEHNVEDLATIGDLSLYKTNMDNYNKYKNTFEHLFDVEEEQVYKVSPVSFISKGTGASVENNNILFVQEPGNLEFKVQESVPWHLDRISKRNLPLDGTYAYSLPGSCHRNSDVEIETVVVDTGCDVTHPEFEGRATFLENFTGDNEDYDGNSHGTHCSGIIGSKTYGVCKDAKIKCVKVLDSQGSGSTSGVIAGLNYAFNRHLQNEKKNPKLRTIISMSLGGGKSLAMNRAVENMVKTSNTFYIVVAAGNENQDVKSSSPASARGIFSVMAMGRDDQRAYFSNFGRTVSLYSTGVEVKSTIPGGKTAVYSGTSMACPAAVGVLNHYLDMYPRMNMKQIKEKMLNDATKDTIEGNPKNTPNLMIFLERND